jgi:hypothetical protein
MALSTLGLIATLIINDTKHQRLTWNNETENVVMMSEAFSYCYGKCACAVCPFTELTSWCLLLLGGVSLCHF